MEHDIATSFIDQCVLKLSLMASIKIDENLTRYLVTRISENNDSDHPTYDAVVETISNAKSRKNGTDQKEDTRPIRLKSDCNCQCTLIQVNC